MGVVQQLKSRWNELADRYIAGESTYDIGKELCIDPAYIRQILIKLSIPRRSRAQVLQKLANDIPISKELRDRLTGWLLGDGNLTYTGLSSYFQLSSKHEEYIDFAKAAFEKEGIRCRKYKQVDKTYKTTSFRLATICTLQLEELRKCWYRDKIKIVPNDIALSSIAIQHWIMDDGTLDKKKGHMRFCTCSFSIEECELLSQKLNEFLGITNASWVIEKKKYPRIYIPKRHVKCLLNKAGNCKIECFMYKWSTVA